MQREINDFVGWGLDGYGNATLFCSHCRAVFYKTAIYPTESECTIMLARIKERKPSAVLMCGEVYR
ncbi:Uncharacterised protein [Yersinia frederiksenii]|nr:Uncharacterised protein [Yersinia frederiksenii]